MHRDQDPGLGAEDEIVCTGLKHGTLPGINREEGHVDLLLFKRFDGLAELSVRFFDLLHGGFFPPVPEIQVPRVEDPDTAELRQKTDAKVCGIKSGYSKLIRQLQGVPRCHPLAAGAHGHI